MDSEHDPTVAQCACKVCEAWRRRIRALAERWRNTGSQLGFESYLNFANDLEGTLLV